MLLSGAALRRREVIAGLPARGVANRNVRRFESLFKGRHRLLPFLQEPPGLRPSRGVLSTPMGNVTTPVRLWKAQIDRRRRTMRLPRLAVAILLANALAFFIVAMVALAARAETFITLLTPEPVRPPPLRHHQHRPQQGLRHHSRHWWCHRPLSRPLQATQTYSHHCRRPVQFRLHPRPRQR